MNSISKINKELLFIKFPIIFPITYGSILYLFPNFEIQLIFITILLLAETHFAATWPFLLHKVNFHYIQTKKINLIIIPIIIVFLCLFGFFLFKDIFLLIFFASNVFHVTRQSFGVCKLYCKDNLEKKVQEYLIYFINFLFFIVGYFRFYIPVIDNENLVLLNIFAFTGLIFVFIYYVYKFKFTENFLTFVTGSLIFYPFCFVNNPVHAIIMGVTMHYTQYLYLTHHVYMQRQSANENLIQPSFLGIKYYKYIFTLVIYAVVMSVLSIFGKFEESFLKYLIIIPIIGQMLHFYLDSQLWKFSEKHNRDNILVHINKISQ